MLNVAPSNLIYIYNSKLEVFFPLQICSIRKNENSFGFYGKGIFQGYWLVHGESWIYNTIKSVVGRRAAYITRAGRLTLGIYMVPVPHQDMPVFWGIGG
jgi:hypothetical protein